ncbi:MAG: glycine--tRNA ligase subunit beta [Candidatus Paracaedibacteraceae bacterium]|nr:glycine--tRNA ligase subunit beta [Candidatus Paracaedibacteraceae bacterium]
MTNQFIFEILSEEIPARMQVKAAGDFKRAFEDKLAAAGLSFSSVETHITPRRLVACIHGIAPSTVATQEERRGPKVNAPEAALAGFLKSTGLTQDQLVEKDGYWYALIETTATATADILPNLCREIIRELSWPKSMRWYGAPQSWVRPVRGIMAVLNGQTLSFDVPEFGLTSTNTTSGHRFLSSGTFIVTDFSQYKAELLVRKVILNHQERQDSILKSLVEQGQAKGFILEQDDKLLEEVAGLSEFPQPILGTIDESFMHLPKGVLATSMRVHQKYFIFTDKAGLVASIFGLVANTIPSDDGVTMLRGYERVLKARLSDAKFFYEHDLKVALRDHLPRLDSIIFHSKLGTLGQRVQRLIKLVESSHAKRAAELCKSDLVTAMVGEFPELQGYMGGVYAVAQGQALDVGQAIEQHYQPAGPHDVCPSTPVAIELALAEKLDTLVGFFAIGEIPTGSKDPYALRRAALGILRLIRENNLIDLSLLPKISRAFGLYMDQGISIAAEFSPQQVFDFILERLSHALRAEGLRHDTIAAVISSSNCGDNICAIVERISALNTYLCSDAGVSLRATFKRAHGILPKEGTFVVHANLFNEAVESKLHHELMTVSNQCQGYLERHDYANLMQVLANLKDPIDAFFDLKINDDNPEVRQNRLALLAMMIEQTSIIADFSKLEG